MSFGPNRGGWLYWTTPACTFCGQSSLVALDPEKLAAWTAGTHIQVVWPDKTPDERELLITGTHPACWDAITGGDSDDG